MSHLAMLDTNIVSELARSPRGRLLEQIAIVGEDRICISTITAAELRYGIRKKGSVKLERDIGAVLATLDILPFEPPTDAFYGQIRHALTSTGTPIGPVDFFIAAHALSLGLTLVTANIGEFSRVPGLKVENWLD